MTKTNSTNDKLSSIGCKVMKTSSMIMTNDSMNNTTREAVTCFVYSIVLTNGDASALIGNL